MPKTSDIVVGFNGGEVSPNMESRPELDFYSRSASVVENSDVLPEGGGKKRGGTGYVIDCEDPTAASHLKTFSYSDDYSYKLEFSPTKLRIFRVQTQALVATFDSPYTVAQARQVQIERKNDVMWLVHPEVPEYELKRTGISAFTFSEYEYDYPPLLEKDTTGINMTPSARIGSGIGLVASADWFEDDHIGSHIAVNQLRLTSNIVGTVEFGPNITQSLAATATTTNSLWAAFSEFSLSTSGTWTGRLSIEESVDDGTSWTEIFFVTDTTNGDTQNFINLLFTGRRPANSQLRIRFIHDSGTVNVSLAVQETYNYGLAKITGVTDAQNATIEIVSDFYDSSSTYEWYEGAFNARNGYPRALALFDGAKWYFGNAVEPAMAWRSLIDNFYNFKIGVNDDEGIRRRADTKGTAMFAIAKDELILVTSHDVITLKASDNTGVITPSNLVFVYQNGDGSAYQQGEYANDAVVFVQKGAKKVRDLIYSDDTKTYVTNDISALAKHISKIGILETSIERLPEQRVGCILKNGEIGLVTYERSEGIVSWQRYVTDGKFHSRSVSDNGEEDSVWYVAERNGRFVIEVQKSTELDPTWYLDSAVESTTLAACQSFDSLELTADPDYHVQVNKVAHGMTDGKKIRFQNVTGYAYLEDRVFEVSDATADTFLLKDEDGIGYISPYDVLPPIITVLECGTVEAHGDYEYQGMGNRWLHVRADRTVDELVLHDTEGWKHGNYEGVSILDAPLADVIDSEIDDLLDEDLDSILDSTLDSEGYSSLYTNPSTFKLPPQNTGWVDDGGGEPLPVLSWPGSWSTPSTGEFCEVTKIVTGLDHLEGLETLVLVESKRVETHTVEGGGFELNEYAESWIAGLKYAFKLSPLPLEMLEMGSLGNIKQINHVSLKLKESYGGRVYTNGNKSSSINTRKVEDALGQIPELFTGDIKINPEDGWDSVKRIYIEQDIPYPFEVLSLSYEMDLKGRA